MLVVIETLKPWDPREPIYKMISREEMEAFDPKRLEDGVDEYEVGMRYPANIEAAWSEEELAAIGLAKPAPFVAPAGKMATGPMRYELKRGKVHEAYDLVDIPAPVEEADPTKAELLEQIAALQAKVEAMEG